ncbi:MAG TPA: TNT domain-containing protein [Amycolatopsis sp.]|nr:TNT domain-containing protein [Amycolatopsis sp.]
MSDQAEPHRRDPAVDTATGPIRVPAQYGGLLDRGFDDVPTPPAGTRAQPGYQQQPPPVGALRTERESVLALFLVHMFPIGHLPVAADRPALQLPVPEPGRGPFEHPDAGLLDDTETLEYVTRGLRRSPAPAAAPEAPAELFDGYEPGSCDDDPPPAAEEAVVLAVDTLIDRFGDEHGRVFAAEGTPFAQRSLPDSARYAGYRRYRVAKPVPMWRSAAPERSGPAGSGVRYRAVLAADELVTLGFLADVTGEVR